MNRETAPSFVFLGDVFLPTPFRVNIGAAGNLVINLEYPITAAGKPYPGKVILKTDRNWLPLSFGSSLSVACLANNHILDGGAEGLRDTIHELEAMGVKWFGAGPNRAQVRNPITIPMGDALIAMAGYVCPTTTPVLATGETAGVAPIDLASIDADIRKARALGAGRVVVCLHWGAEEVGYPRAEDIQTARRIVDLGADLIIGHHAHCVQPVEVYRGKHIFYGLGNAIMPDLDLPSDYDSTGAPTSRFVKQQRSWNRSSLAVVYEPAKEEVGAFRLRCAGTTVDRVRSWRHYRMLPRGNPPTHDKRFRRTVALARARAVLLYIVEHPTLPRPKHCRQVWNLARNLVVGCGPGGE